MSRLNLVLRSAVFNVAFFAMTVFALVTTWPALIVPRPGPALWIAHTWSNFVFWALRVIVGLRYEVRGDLTPLRGSVLIACNHQSAWDTIVFFMLCDRPTYAMKKELMAIPIYGWLARRQGHIAVDRKAGAAAFRRLQRAAREALTAGRQLVLFPEGTRVPADERRPYQPGIAGLYASLDMPVVPIAVNSGLYWPRRSFTKKPGTVLLEILPTIPAGLARPVFMHELETRIEAAKERLIAEARQGDPRL